MGEASDELGRLRDPRLGVHAVRPVPVWVWTTDGRRIVWANPVGAVRLGAASPAAIAGRRFDPSQPAAAEIARVAARLYPGGVASLHRLRALGSRLGRPLVCACSRLTIDETPAVLVVAQEPGDRTMPLAERVSRLLADLSGPFAAFTPAGTLVHANDAAGERLAGATALAALEADALIGRALAEGCVIGRSARGGVELLRLGEGDATVLLVRFGAEVLSQAETIEPAEPETAPEPPAPETAPEPPYAVDVTATVVTPPFAAGRGAGSGAGEPAGPADDDEWESVAWDDDAWADLEEEKPTSRIPLDGPPLLRLDPRAAERRYPLRFVWQMDADGRFTLGSDELTDVLGPKVAIALGRPWQEIADVLGLDPEGRVARAVATRDTWSGITVAFPVEDSDERLPVELSGLPIYDRERRFLGYRGFGVCRDLVRLAALERRARAPVFTMPASPEPPPDGPAPETPPPPPRFSPSAGGLPPRHAPSSPRTPGPDAPGSYSPDSGHGEADPPGGETGKGGEVAENVVRFPAPVGDFRGAGSPELSSVEHNAFEEIARQLHARLAGEPITGMPFFSEPLTGESFAGAGLDVAFSPVAAAAAGAGKAADDEHKALLDRLPVGLLVYRYEELLYANKTFLETTGHASLADLVAAGGLDSLFVAGDADVTASADTLGRSLVILTQRGDRLPVAARLVAIPWEGDSALALILMQAADEPGGASGLALGRAEATIRDLRAVLDTAFDGVVVLGRDGRIVSANHSAEALFGATPGGLAGEPFADLFGPDSRATALDYLERIRDTGTLLVNEGRELTGRVRQGGAIPLFMTMGPMADGSDRLCAVFRDLSPVKKEQETLAALRRDVERAAAGKAEFVATFSHDARTPLNTILGFTELMLEERFGPLGHERYREHLRDVRAATLKMAGLLDDMLNLSRAETGTLELTFTTVDLNEIVQGAVRTMQPQANRERIIIRTSLSPQLSPIVADARSLHQIILNLLANAIRLTGAGGQVIVSTGQSPQGEVVLRVRDTGVGMSGKDLETALQPFKEVATAPSTASAGLGLPLTKALAEANRGTFAISSRVNDGTLVEVTFPRSKIPAE
ncbi:Sensory box histidine kinase [Rhodovulum sp. PH10]|uniref:PAS domain-containing protein n=1 Tax=Rhodovulum sp. PH10 TaxID=1187851 RepID=UPI00027C2A02|nr:PAS domain-containing protein [Rhodovulum sp. PH10]EJW12571.1 Sensory box histidine kinase [Rhodovulum sp. PH10]